MKNDEQIEHTLRGEAKSYQKILENLHEGYLLVDQAGRIYETNAAYCSMMGYSRDEIQAMKLSDLRSDISGDELMDVLANIVEGDSRAFEARHRRKDGTDLDLKVSATAIEKDDRIYIAGMVWDITEQKKAHRKMKIAKQRFQSLFEHNPHAVFLHNLQGDYLGVNSKAEELTGYSKKELLSMRFGALISDEDVERTHHNFEKSKKGKVKKYEVTGITKSGEKKPVRITSFPMIVDDDIVGVFGIAEDITEQQTTYRKLKKANKRFESLFKHNPHPVFYFNLEGYIIDANESLENISDYSHHALLNMSFMALVSEEDRPHAKRKFEATLKGEPQRFEIDGLTKHGKKIPVQIIAFPMIVDDEMTGIYAIAEDISERKRAAKKLRESEERWYRLLKNSPQSVVITVDKTIEYVNKAAVKLLGYDSNADIVGQPLFEFAHPDDWESINERIPQMLNHKVLPLDEQKIIDRSGQVKNVIAHSVHIRYKGQDAIQSVFHDVTARKKREEVIQKSLHEKEIMLQEIHHRVKNNMAVISGLLELQALNTAEPKLQGMLKESQMRIHSMAMIHEKLYASKSLAEIRFSEYAKELVEVIMNTIGDIDTHVTVRYRMDKLTLNINQAIPCGLILNELVTNCYKHAFVGREAGSILVGFSNKNDKIKLSVEDNGTGLPPDFELGNEGGLGMTIVQTLTRQLEGEIITQKGSDGGTCFIITFKEDRSEIDENIRQTDRPAD